MTRYKLPQPALHPHPMRWAPLVISARKLLAHYPEAAGVSAYALGKLREEVRVRRKREAPYRLINLRRRLYAFYWSSWVLCWSRGLIRTLRHESYGIVRPKWLGKPRRPSRRQA